MTTHEVRYGGIGHGFYVVRREQSGRTVKVTGPFTTREQAEQEARQRDTRPASSLWELPIFGWAWTEDA